MCSSPMPAGRRRAAAAAVEVPCASLARSKPEEQSPWAYDPGKRPGTQRGLGLPNEAKRLINCS
jgi:hypothetical protein